MNSLSHWAMAPARLVRRHPWLVIIGAILVANLAYLSGAASSNPMAWTGGPQVVINCLRACNTPSIDPNAGYITAAQGHESALLWLHGHIPWWDYYQGAGAPLAGSLQAASFSPFTLLLALPNGFLWLHIGYQMIGGLGTYGLMRRLTPSTRAAVLAGSLFGLNGTFAWIGNAAVNPVCFIPLLVLGVEYIVDQVRARSTSGWKFFAVSLALSLLGGFPEVTFMSLFLVAAWALARAIQLSTWRERRTFFLALSGAGLCAVAVASPVLVAFADYLPHAYTGWHGSGALSSPTLSGSSLALFGVPYNLGGLWQLATANDYWGMAGGFVGILALFCAAFAGRRGPHLGLRVAVAAVALVFIAGSFNVPFFHHFLDLIPGMKKTAYARYSPAIWEFAISLLAGWGVGALSTVRRRLTVLIPGFVLSVWVAVNWWYYRTHLAASSTPLGHSWDVYRLGLIAMVAASSMGLAWRYRDRVIDAIVIMAVLEAVTLFAIPMSGAPSTVISDTDSVSYLSAHLATSRYVTLRPLFPNWGSYFSLGSIQAINLPIPADFVHYSATMLNPLAPQPQQIVPPTNPDITSPDFTAFQNMVASLLGNYEHAAVRYLLLPHGMTESPALVRAGVTLVHDGPFVSIYQLPHDEPLMTASSGCTIESQSLNVATVNCAVAGTLLRREQFMPGWTARTDGGNLTISEAEGLYQSVALSPGRHTITFNFLPPHEQLAGVALLGGVVALWSPWLLRSSRGRERFARRRPRASRSGAARSE